MSSRAVRTALVVLLGGAAIVTAAGAQEDRQPGSAPADPALVAHGKQLFTESCSSCHGDDLRGIHNPDERIPLAELDRGVERLRRVVWAYAVPAVH